MNRLPSTLELKLELAGKKFQKQIRKELYPQKHFDNLDFFDAPELVQRINKELKITSIPRSWHPTLTLLKKKFLPIIFGAKIAKKLKIQAIDRPYASQICTRKGIQFKINI